MIDIDFAQATFEYIVRKKINDGELPLNGTNISSNNRYFTVNWKGLTIQQLWTELVDEEFLATIPEEDQEELFHGILKIFIDNLSITDPAIPGSEFTLSDLQHWVSVKNIPKKYYRN